MNRAEMRTRLAAAWEDRGWEYDSLSVRSLLDSIAARGEVDATALASKLSGSYLTKIGASRDEVAGAIEGSIGSEQFSADQPSQLPSSITARGDVITINLAEGAQITGSSFNFSGNQVNLDGADKGELLAALQAVLLGGLTGSWDPKAAVAVGNAIEAQGSFQVDEVRDAVVDLGRDPALEGSQISGLLEKVAVSGLGNFLSVAISSGLTDLLHQIG